MALYSLHCADVPLRNCSLTHSNNVEGHECPTYRTSNFLRYSADPHYYRLLRHRGRIKHSRIHRQIYIYRHALRSKNHKVTSDSRVAKSSEKALEYRIFCRINTDHILNARRCTYFFLDMPRSLYDSKCWAFLLPSAANLVGRCRVSLNFFLACSSMSQRPLPVLNRGVKPNREISVTHVTARTGWPPKLSRHCLSGSF